MKEQLDNKIAQLSSWVREQLTTEFKALLGKSPPDGLSLTLLRCAIAYQWQVKATGSEQLIKDIARQVKNNTTKNNKVRQVAAGGGKPSVWDHTTQIRPGTHLRRVWKGRTVEAVSEANGFRVDGQLYGSLSEAARSITGTRWNGHLFFGLKTKKVTA